ncbi:putative metal-dependent hydrolase YcfH [Achromobacter deleyi]|uniref:Putative metal-dependent hydrolase YcfH n=1 Tax=Achromobacter deleyi TaxID=1353891 RepID=A0A6S7BKG6_9BURK|nr:TatD family hydrolase [Achromobacter deleyi]CAB3734166.1 putative metal-dependent hydrolase YcfH [Achromobacter deleyi]CAB3902696.1 putative metal-dependent hydrolase YcfH [Achromobacter deleyi]CAB3910500.1 putative metal-dependent hydrolase YcfH [Achromobacter deleyi]CAB3927095.1 putative metal-dependent hydrolase YcfH [Achromobacter deleyi]
MYVDSHCHLNFPELAADLPAILDRMAANQVTHALVVSVNMPEWPGLMSLVEPQANLWASVGVHPDYEDTPDPEPAELLRLAAHPKVVAIGETGLDYYRLSEPLDWQRERFRRHIRAARDVGLPLIVHTRSSAEDTVRMLREEGAAEVGGVMHCFTETWEVAQAALDQNFHISLSGIVTFKNAHIVHEVAAKVPLDRLLIETDSPYLAPVPYRGKINDPSKVIHVAEKIADLKGISVAEVAKASTENFFNLFNKIKR